MYRLVVIPVIFNSFASLSFQFGLSDGPDIKLIVFVGAKAFLVSWSFLYSYILMSFFFFFLFVCFDIAVVPIPICCTCICRDIIFVSS